jgi:hypothetical protein
LGSDFHSPTHPFFCGLSLILLPIPPYPSALLPLPIFFTSPACPACLPSTRLTLPLHNPYLSPACPSRSLPPTSPPSSPCSPESSLTTYTSFPFPPTFILLALAHPLPTPHDLCLPWRTPTHTPPAPTLCRAHPCPFGTLPALPSPRPTNPPPPRPPSR